MEPLSGTIHEIPSDMSEVISQDESLLQKWNALTPLARNEWICWVTIYQKSETREKHLIRIQEDILAGKKRPCCWPGCPHHNPKTAQYFHNI